MISLLSWLQGLLADPETRAAFFTDPDGVTGSAGLDHLTAADFHDALILVSDTEPVSYHDRFAGPPIQHATTDIDALAGQSPGDYLRGYLATSYPTEANDPGSFAGDWDNDPLAHDGWTEPGADHGVTAVTASDAVHPIDPEFGAGFSGEANAEPDYAAGDRSVHSSEVTGPSQLDHHGDGVAITHDSTGYESPLDESLLGLRSDLDHDDHSEHEFHHPPL